VDLGFDSETARKASAKARELGLPMKEAIDQLVSGTLFDSKPAAKPAQPKPEPPDEMHRKVMELGYDADTARRASAKTKELNLPLKEAVDRLLSGTLFDSKEPSRTQTPAPAPQPKPVPVQIPTPKPASTPSSNAAPASDALFGSMLEIQEKSLLRKTWKPFYFILSNGEIVYGPPSWTPSPFAPLGVDDVEEVGRIPLATNWSVFEKESGDDQGFIFEVHNPRGTAGQFTLKAESADLRSEWISRVRKAIRDLESKRSTTLPPAHAPVSSTTTAPSSQRTPAPSSAPSTTAPVSNANKQQMVDKLVGMGFSRKLAQEAASGATSVDDAVERVMSLQSLDNSADEPPRLSSPPRVTAPSSTSSSLYGGASLASPTPSHNTSTYPSTQNTPSSGSFPPPSVGGGDRGMAKCGNCGSSFSYVIGTPRVQCQTCGVVNNVPVSQPNVGGGLPPATPNAVQLQCGYCKTQHEVQRGQSSFVCRQCGVNNQVKL